VDDHFWALTGGRLVVHIDGPVCGYLMFEAILKSKQKSNY
jgi:hypothetical protein